MIMEKIIVKHTMGEYPIYVGEDILEDALCEFFKTRSYDRIFIVTDSNVSRLYDNKLHETLEKLDITFCGYYSFLAGEKSKNLGTVSEMYDMFAKTHLTRKSLVIALGGGVVGDMAGFAAATFLRGIDVLQIPTTLLSQIDSSIGGKTGVDLEYGKNLVGAFHQPVAVISDSLFLETLPKHFVNDGVGEAIKTGLIGDAELFCGIETQTISRAELITRCARFKADIVTKDEFESGLRKILNFGHTIGHAVEKLGNFERFSHGESVGIGMLYAAKIGEKLGYMKCFERIKSTLKLCGLPTDMDYLPDELINIAASDKKRSGDSISFILLDEIGTPKIVDINIDELRGML